MLGSGKGRVSGAGVTLGVDSRAGRGDFPAGSRVKAGCGATWDSDSRHPSSSVIWGRSSY